MSSGAQPPAPSWQWSAALQTYFWYDERPDELVLQSGRRIARPRDIPRAALRPQPASQSDLTQQYQYSGSPPGSNEAYTFRNTAGSAGGRRDTLSSGSIDSRAGPSNQQRPRQGEPGYEALSTQIAGLTIEQRQRLAQQQQTREQQVRDEQYAQQQFRRLGPPQVRNYEVQGRHLVYASQPSGVQSRFQERPNVTDPALSKLGVHAHRVVLETEGDEERLFPDFKRRDQPRKFFTIGKVFLILWVEPAGENANTVITSLEPSIPLPAGESIGRYGERVFSKVRRFVVIREGLTYCSALPIASYGSRGVAKRGVTKSEHAIIYTGKSVPEPTPAERPDRGEAGLRPQAVRVDTDHPTDKLDPMSRLDFGKVHTIQHNIKVKSFGKVNRDSMSAFQHQWANVWRITQRLPKASSSRGGGNGSEDDEDDDDDEDEDDDDTSGDEDPAETQRRRNAQAVSALQKAGIPRDEAVRIVKERIMQHQQRQQVEASQHVQGKGKAAVTSSAAQSAGTTSKTQATASSSTPRYSTSQTVAGQVRAPAAPLPSQSYGTSGASGGGQTQSTRYAPVTSSGPAPAPAARRPSQLPEDRPPQTRPQPRATVSSRTQSSGRSMPSTSSRRARSTNRSRRPRADDDDDSDDSA